MKAELYNVKVPYKTLFVLHPTISSNLFGIRIEETFNSCEMYVYFDSSS